MCGWSLWIFHGFWPTNYSMDLAIMRKIMVARNLREKWSGITALSQDSMLNQGGEAIKNRSG
jgi:hypothetical protein